MNRNIIRGFLVVWAFLISINSFADNVKSSTEVVDDQVLEKTISEKLSAQFSSGSYTIVSYRQNVLLAGQVATSEIKNKIDSSIKDVSGVKKFWNELKVKPNETATEQGKDAALTALAKAKLIAQKDVNSTHIKVVTCDKVVYLLGEDPGDKKQLDKGIRSIRQIKGVTRVVNLIQ